VAVKAGDGEALTAVRLAERFGFNPKYVERHLKVARSLSVDERDLLLARYPRAPLDPLEKLVGWLSSPAGHGLDAGVRLQVVSLFAERRPPARKVEALLRPFAVKKRPGRPAGVRLRAGPTKEGGFEVSFRIPPIHATRESVLARAEAELESALTELRRFRKERFGG
jgi:hypothetical protein